MKSEHSEKDQKLLVNIPVKEREKTILLEGMTAHNTNSNYNTSTCSLAANLFDNLCFRLNDSLRFVSS